MDINITKDNVKINSLFEYTKFGALIKNNLDKPALFCNFAKYY